MYLFFSQDDLVSVNLCKFDVNSALRLIPVFNEDDTGTFFSV